MGADAEFGQGSGFRHLSHERQARLLDIGPRLAASPDLSALMQVAIESAVEAAGAESGAIYLLRGTELFLGATTPSLPEDFPDHLRRADLSDHPTIAQAIHTMSPVYVDDLRAVDLAPAEQAAMESRDLRTVLYVPLVSAAQPVGIFMVGSTQRVAPIGPTEAAVCFTLSGLIALALQNSQLLESVAVTAEELADALDQAEEHRSRLRALATRITEAEERERRRLAEEIHDRVLQPLAALKMYLDQCRASIWTLEASAVSDALRAEVEAAGRILRDALDEARVLMLETSPPTPSELGLVRAVEWLGEHIASFGIGVDFDAPADSAVEAVEAGTALLAARVAREALYNVLKHSGSARATVTLRVEPDDTVVLTVADTGRGFDVGLIDPVPGSEGGFGLFGLRERVAFAGGTLAVESTPGVGTTVSARLPQRRQPQSQRG